MTNPKFELDFSRVCQIKQETCSHLSGRKTSIKPPTITDIIFHRRNVPRSQYYLSNGHEHLEEPRNINNEQSPYFFPPDTHLFAYSHYLKAWKHHDLKDRRAAKYKNADNYRAFRSSSVLQRLHVDVESEAEKIHTNPDEDIAITDVDPQYFTELRGRVVKERFSRRQYVSDTNEILKNQLIAGYEKDYCILIDHQFDEERKRFLKAKNEYNLCRNAFEEFLAEDYKKSAHLLQEAEEEVKKTNILSAKLSQLTKEFGQVKLEVYHWEDAWRMVKTCQKFLFQVSPVSRMEQHDLLPRDCNENTTMVQASTTLVKHQMLSSIASLESLIEIFEQDIAEMKPPELYFKDPSNLIRVFREIEEQNFNALIHLESLAGPVDDMANSAGEIKANLDHEINEIDGEVKELKETISLQLNRANELEQHANRLLHGIFRDLVCSEPVLYLRVFIEDAYEHCVKSNDANFDNFIMMRSIERKYEQLNIQLDNFPHDVVVACEKEGFRKEIKKMKDAEEAARKFELMHRLLESLKRIMEPPEPKRRQLMWRSVPKVPKVLPIPAPPPFTNEEILYLKFFTNYNQLYTPSKQIRSLIPQDIFLKLKNGKSKINRKVIDRRICD